jgi:preprotein translocase subunit SecE
MTATHRNKRTGTNDMAKTSPGEFIRQVRAEVGKVVWPTRAETTQTAIMVLILTIILAIFFLGVDAVFNGIVQALLSLASGS